MQAQMLTLLSIFLDTKMSSWKDQEVEDISMFRFNKFWRNEEIWIQRPEFKIRIYDIGMWISTRPGISALKHSCSVPSMRTKLSSVSNLQYSTWLPKIYRNTMQNSTGQYRTVIKA